MALTDGLISYWKLEESSGTRIDSFGSNNLSDNNTVTANPGKINTAAQFTSANTEYLSIADNPSISTGDIDFSWAGWVYLDSTAADMAIFSKTDNSTVDEYQLIYLTASSRFRWGVNNQRVTLNSFGAPSTATWYFFYCEHNSVTNTVNASINNGTLDSAAAAVGGADTAFAFNIGGNNGSSTLNGRVDELGFWKRTLTAAEITELYNNGNGIQYPFFFPKSIAYFM